MTVLAAERLDGETSAARTVELSCDERGHLLVRADGLRLEYPRHRYRVAPPLGNLRREIKFDDGSICQCRDTARFDSMFKSHGIARLVDRWERHFGYVVLAGVGAGAVIWLAIEFGIPYAAKRAAFALPESAEARLGGDAMNILDKLVFSPSRLPAARQLQLAGLFARIKKDVAPNEPLVLALRSGGIAGANAFALPSGTVVLTDELVALAKRDEQLIAVMAHEVGHVKNRHTLRQVLQNSAAALFVIAIGGDPVSASSFAATLPTVLVQTKFSRAFETEADSYAANYLQQRGMAPAHLAHMLRALSTSAGVDPANEIGFLSTHPATADRTRTLESGTPP